MSKQHYITASRQPSPAFVEISAMLEAMNKQIDQLGEIMALLVAASDVTKAKAASREGARPVEQEVLAGMFPGEAIH